MTNAKSAPHLEAVQRALADLMKKRGIAPKTLSRLSGMNETAVRDIMQGRVMDVKVGTLRKLATVLDSSLGEMLSESSIPIIGRIGAGGSIMLGAEADDVVHVPRPPVSERQPLIALEVSGDSMLPKFEAGDVVYIRRDHEGVLPEYVGQYCAVSTHDGEMFLKLLASGSLPGRFTLRSLNAADMENVELAWASPVLWVLPAFSRRHSY